MLSDLAVMPSDSRLDEHTAVYMNDTQNLPFKKIADRVEKW